MSKHTIKGFVHHCKETWDEHATYEIFPFSMQGTLASRVLVGEQEFEVEIPDDFNPIPLQLAVLEEQKRRVRLKLAEQLADIDAQISKLTCIEHSAVEVEL